MGWFPSTFPGGVHFQVRKCEFQGGYQISTTTEISSFTPMDFTPFFFVEKDFQQQQIPGMDGFKGGNEWMFWLFSQPFP